MTNKKIGETIRLYRKAKKLKQAQLAEQANLSTPTISLIESGRHTARQSTIDSLASILGIPKDAFVDGSSKSEDGLEKSIGHLQASTTADSVIAHEMRFPLGLTIGEFHVQIEPAYKNDILRLIYWSLATGIISREDVSKILQGKG